MKLKIILITVFYFVFSVQIKAQGKSATETIGDYTQLAIPTAGLISSLAIKDYEGTKQFAYSFTTSLAVTYILKYSINKQRPEGHGSHSFPSGHTSFAFQGAAFIQRRYGWWYGIPAYVGAAYVGWSRVEGESDKHDTWDVLGGAVLGIASSYLFVKPYHDKKVTVSLLPAYSQGRLALYAHITF